MKNNKVIISLLLCLVMVLAIIPIPVFAATYNGNEVEAVVSGKFDYGLPTNDAKVIGYMTPNAGELKIKSSDDDTMVIELYMEDGWSFQGWQTLYKGPSTDSENERWDDGYYFSAEGDMTTPIGHSYATKTANTIQINKEYGAGGALGCTYYVYAICNPIITYSADRSVVFNTGTDEFSLSTFLTSVTYNDNTSITVKPPEKYMISNVSVNGKSSNYKPATSDCLVKSDPQEYKLAINNIKGPVDVQISTKLLPQATYTAPTPNILTYNGSEQNLVSAGTSEGGTLMYSLEKDGEYSKTIPTATNADTYTVWYYVKGDDNHNDTEKSSVDVKIEKMDPKIGTVSAKDVNNTTDISAIVLERTDETTEGSLIVKEGQTLNLGENEIEYIFTPKDSSNYNLIEGKVNVTVNDTIAPVGTVTLTDAETVWDRIPETITFEMYFKNDQKAVVEAADSFSGLDKVEYYEINEILDLEGIKLLADDEWQVLNEDVVTIAEDAKQFIYYIRITDKAGNIAYLATNGAEFDTAAPVISGVDDGKTYYTSQEIIVTDKNLETVTLNGEEVTDTIILEGNKEASYIIEAKDKAGNSTTVTIKIALLEDITDVNAENVTKEDKTELENAKNELEKNLEQNAEIYSDEETKAIEDKIKQIDEALKVIANVKNVEELINTLPEDITENDTDAVEAAEKAYKELSDYEKTLIDSETEKKLDEAIKKLEEVKQEEVEQEKIEQEEINNEETEIEINSQTGDNIVLYVFLLIASILIIIIIGKKVLMKKGKYML